MNDGGRAFAMPGFCVPGNPDKHATWSRGYGGMSLRDWFAGMYLTSIPAEAYDNKPETFARDNKPETFARVAYRLADAMLKHRADTGETQ